jgi:ribokinase
MAGEIVILGVFVADTAYRADRQARMGETILGNAFSLGPGGKGSNQAVAAARAGAAAHFITRLGRDPFADMALDSWAGAGVTPQVIRDPERPTGAACIFVEEGTGENAIIICPGAGEAITAADVDAHRALIEGAAVFMTQLEQPVEAAWRGLEIARAAGVTTILNPAPAAPLPDGLLALCDYVTPNETEVEALTGTIVTGRDGAARAAQVLRARGVRRVVITLGEKGAFYQDESGAMLVPAFDAGPVVETTGAGDAFNGGFAAGLARGLLPIEAVRFGCAAAALSVTRPGTARSMPSLTEIEDILR